MGWEMGVELELECVECIIIIIWIIYFEFDSKFSKGRGEQSRGVCVYFVIQILFDIY